MPRRSRRKRSAQKAADAKSSIGPSAIWAFFFSMNEKERSDAFVNTLVFLGICALAFLILAVPVFTAYANGTLDYDSAKFISSTTLSLTFSVSVFAYLGLYKRHGIHEIIDELGLSRRRLSLKIIGIGLLLFLFLLAMEAGIGILSVLTNTQINTNVGNVIGGAPLWFIFFTAIFVPINEEIMFRGFLVPRLGISVSSILFAVPHLAYNATFAVEMIFALAFGLSAGYVFKKTKSLYPSIIAHMITDAITAVQCGVLGVC